MSLPETWVQVQLTDVCELNPRYSAGNRTVDDTNVTFVPMSAVNEYYGIINKAETRKFGEVSKGYTNFREHDVLFAKVTPCMENGKVAIARKLENGLGFGSTEFHVLRPTEVVLPEYIFSLIRQKSFRDRAAAAFMGTGGLQRVPSDFLARVKIPLPTLHEQQRIVNLLQQSQLLLKAKKSISEQIDQLIRTSYWEYFGDWYTADGLVNPVRISECVANSQYGVSEAMEDRGTNAVLRMNSITTSGWLDFSDLKYASLSKKDIESTRLLDGDLLFNRTNSKELVGKCAIWRPTTAEFSFASYLVRLRLKPKMLPEFLWATLNSAYGKYRLLNSAKQAVSMANVSPTDLGRITVPLPPLSLQVRFAKFVQAIEELRTQMLRELDVFVELHDVVSQQALIGDLTSQWRVDHVAEIAQAARARDSLLRELGTRVDSRSHIDTTPEITKSELPIHPARQWLFAELSEFQRQVFAVFIEYCEQSGRPLLVEDPEVFALFCGESGVIERLEHFGEFLGNRIRRTLSQLAALGLIAKVTLPKKNLETDEIDYLKAFRPLRSDEHSRLADLQSIRNSLSPPINYYFSAHLDYETSEHVGAGGMFQVVSIEDDDGKDFTYLIDQGKHYGSLDALKMDLASALKVEVYQVDLEEV